MAGNPLPTHDGGGEADLVPRGGAVDYNLGSKACSTQWTRGHLVAAPWRRHGEDAVEDRTVRLTTPRRMPGRRPPMVADGEAQIVIGGIAWTYPSPKRSCFGGPTDLTLDPAWYRDGEERARD